MSILLIIMLAQNFMLFLNSKADLERKSRGLLTQAAALILFGTIITFAFSADTIAPVDTVIFKGHTIRADGSGTFDVAGKASFNYSQFSHFPWDYVYLNLSNKIGANKEVTLSTDAYVGLIEQLNATGSWNTINISTFNNEWNITTTSTVTRGFTFTILNAENRQFRILISNAAKDDGTYSWFHNTSILGTMFVLEFDPLLGGVNVAGQSKGSVAMALSPCCLGGSPITNLNDENFVTGNVQTGQDNQNTITFIINLSAPRAVNMSRIIPTNTAHEPTDYNISGNGNATGKYTDTELGNMTWVLLKSVVGNTEAVNITDNFVNNQSYNRYKIDVSKWNNGDSGPASPNGMAWNEWALFNTTNESGVVTALPIMRNNGTNTTTITKGVTVRNAANFSSTNTLTFVALQHNMTSDGAFTNITIPASGTNFNATANITILFGNTTNYVTKWYVNTSTEENNTIPSASYTTSNTAPFGIPRINIPPNQSVFNVSSVTFNTTNISDVDNNTITLYWYLNDVLNTTSNPPAGDNTRGNITVTGLNSGNYTMRIQAYDGTSFTANSTTTNFTVDTIAPAIVFIANTLADNSFSNINSLFINTSENDAGSDHNDFSAFIDFNNSLVGYWRFEDGNGTSAVDTSNYSNTGTLTNFGCTSLNCNLTGGVGGTGSGWTSAGKRGKAIMFDGENDYIDAGGANSIDSITGDLTIAAWVKRNGDPGDSEIVSTHQGKTDLTRPYSLIVFNSGATPGLRVGNGAAQFAAQGGTVINGNWHFLAGTINGTSIRFYLDGVLRGTDTFAGTRQTGTKVVIGASTTGAGDRLFNGSMDEVMIWNRALSETEINASYNAGTYRLFRNFTGLNDGNYSFRAFVVDVAGNINNTGTARNATIDTIFPTWNFSISSEVNNSFISKNWIRINVSSTELNPSTVNVTIKNGTNMVSSQNYSLNTTPLWNSVNFTGLADGKYNITTYVSDRAGNLNTSTNLTATVDTTLPIIENGSISTTSAIAGNPFTITAYYSELWLSNVTTTIAGTNYTMNCGTTSCTFTFTNTSTQGTYVTDRFYAQDKAGNTATNITSLTFTATAPGGVASSGGGGGGGGGLVIVEKDTGLTIIINGTLTATPPTINTYANYFVSGDKPKTWSKSIRTNSILDKCLITPPFTCTLNPQDKTQATISLTYTQTGFTKTFNTQLTLANAADNAVTVPVKITSFNLGASTPVKFKISEDLKFLTPSLFFNHHPDGNAQLRWVALVLLLFVPTLLPPVKGLARAARSGGNGRMKSPA